MKVGGATIFIVGRESPQPPPLDDSPDVFQSQLYGLHVHHEFAQHLVASCFCSCDMDFISCDMRVVR